MAELYFTSDTHSYVYPTDYISEGRKNMGYIMPSSISKSFLNGIEPFARERAAANELYTEMEKNQTLNLTPGQFAALNNRIIRDIVNKSLKKYLTGSLTEKSYQQFMRDLANYYSLSVKI